MTTKWLVIIGILVAVLGIAAVACDDESEEELTAQLCSDLASLGGVHGRGTLWAATLWEMYWELVDEHGWVAHQSGIAVRTRVEVPRAAP